MTQVRRTLLLASGQRIRAKYAEWVRQSVGCTHVVVVGGVQAAARKNWPKDPAVVAYIVDASGHKLADNLQRTEAAYATTREDLAEAKHSRQQRELEVQGLFERKETELAAKAERVVELERNLSDAKEDLQNLRKTVTLRDDRITELLNRARQADEQQVALEGQVFRLGTQAQERPHLVGRRHPAPDRQRHEAFA